MDDNLKNAIMIALLAGNITIIISMVATDYSYLISIPAGLVVGAIGFFVGKMMA